MRVATRITAASAVVTALATTAYAVYDLRHRGDERWTQLENEGRAVAAALRPTLELDAATPRGPDAALLTDLSRVTGWQVVVLPRSRAVAPPTDDVTEAQLRRLRTLLEVPKLTFADTQGGRYSFSSALRRGSKGEEVTLAMLEVSRSTSFIDERASADIWGAVLLVVLVVLAVVLAVGGLARSLVSGPITNLLRGIDEVAKGDLSHALLSQRDDEIGAIATRFNEMTFSLRESRAETERQNHAKLELEQRLGQTEKLATIGQLAAEIAHEVGTPLNVIAVRAKATAKRATEPEVVAKNAEIIAEQTARITRIIQRLLDFARRKVGGPGRERVNLNELSLTTMELLSSQFSAGKVKTRLVRAEGLPAVAGDPDRLQQVLINLLLNAQQAMPEGGALTVETSQILRTRPGLAEGPAQRFVQLEVADTGGGIPPEIQDKIFDPFFTTKKGSGGTGLGLAVCSGIVKEHDGWIDVESAPGGGAVFRVLLPC
ncbi:MAG: HAMP domain-containing protein [Myxococcales bacterium]|nr:HAMP domain-containing protein [Myxococcales bacterium]